ncbi:MAG: STAS domain-containing protein [Polyangiaceae bacterium]|nr:STAS domain-containing protein [Polyangiaceae bacterium]
MTQTVQEGAGGERAHGESSSAVSAVVATVAEVIKGNLRARVDVGEGATESSKALASAVNQLIVAWRDSELRARKTKRALEEKVATVETQAVAIRELSTPVMAIWRDILLVPIVGSIDKRRGAEITTELLHQLSQSTAKQVIVDVTGVQLADEETADQLVQLVRSAALLGTRCVVTGMSPAVAQTFVAIGANLAELRTHRTLEMGLRDCINEAASIT